MTTKESLTLVIGGARSGKSRYAEDMARPFTGKKIYLATAEAGDAEMAARIQHHRVRRGADWTTVEEPFALAEAIEKNAAPGSFILVDCLTLWLTNLLLAGRNVGTESDRLVDALQKAAASIVLVSNEVGQGIVPENALARNFRDEAGRLNQRMAGVADLVVLVAAGLPLALKGELTIS